MKQILKLHDVINLDKINSEKDLYKIARYLESLFSGKLLINEQVTNFKEL